MSSTQPKFLAATAVGITLSAFFIGGNLALSTVSIPALLLPPTSDAKSTSKSAPSTADAQLARQWCFTYDNAKAEAIPLIVGGALSLGYAAFLLPPFLAAQRYLYVSSATLFVLVMPYTLTVMHPTNLELMRRAADGEAVAEVQEGDVTGAGRLTTKGVKGQRTADLIRQWAMLNIGRASLPLLSIGCVVTALVW